MKRLLLSFACAAMFITVGMADTQTKGPLTVTFRIPEGRTSQTAIYMKTDDAAAVGFRVTIHFLSNGEEKSQTVEVRRSPFMWTIAEYWIDFSQAAVKFESLDVEQLYVVTSFTMN